jgi:hypothetical protein
VFDRTLCAVGTSYVLFFLGILSTAASMAIVATTRPLRGGVITTGTVVRNDRESTRLGGDRTRRMTTYAPVVQFTDQAGVTHEVTSALSGGKSPVVGSIRHVSYLPSDPGRARIMADATTWIPIVLFLVVGLGLLVAAVASR